MDLRSQVPKDIVAPTGDQHLNWMGAPSYWLSDPIHQLQVAAASSFFGEPQYYHSDRPVEVHTIHPLAKKLNSVEPAEWRGKTPVDLMIHAIDKALDHDPEATLEFAAYLRRELHIRKTPQVIMVRAAVHPSQKGSGLVRKYAPAILQRLDEVCTQLELWMTFYGRNPSPRSSLKRAWAERIARATKYEVAKYRRANKTKNRPLKSQASLVDVMNLCHPKGDIPDALAKGLIKLDEDQTWEAIRSAGGTWASAVQVMGHMALLRNLRNLSQDNELTDTVLQKLIMGAEKGKQLPFRYITAYKILKGIGVPKKALEAVEECLRLTMGNLPVLRGKVMSLSDNSGSTHQPISAFGSSQVCDVGNLMSAITAMIAEEGHVASFGDKCDGFEVDSLDNIFDIAMRLRSLDVGPGTETGIWTFWRDAIDEKEHWDTVFVYSDQQAGHGALYGSDIRSKDAVDVTYGAYRNIDVPKMIIEYREKVNPKVNVVLVQTAGYQDTIVPEYFYRTYLLGGWSPEIIRFADYMIRMTDKD